MLINHNCWYFSSARFADIDSGSNKAEMLRKLRATEWFKGGAWDDGLPHLDILYQGDPSKKWTETPKKPWFNRGIHAHIWNYFRGVYGVFPLRGMGLTWINQLGDQPDQPEPEGVKLLFKWIGNQTLMNGMNLDTQNFCSKSCCLHDKKIQKGSRWWKLDRQ